MSPYRIDADAVEWRVSPTCEGGACIGVAHWGDVVLIGNPGAPNDLVSKFTVDEWRHFVAGVKLGHFDDIA